MASFGLIRLGLIAYIFIKIWTTTVQNLISIYQNKNKNIQMSFRSEQNLPKERTNCHASNCKTYHVISYKIAVTINSTIQNLAPSN